MHVEEVLLDDVADDLSCTAPATPALGDLAADSIVTRRVAELQATVEALESFNRSVSHDLRGPLGSIVSLARLASDALDAQDPDLARQMLHLISGQAHRCSELVATLLSLARVDHAPMQRRCIDLNPIAHDVIEQLRVERTDAHAPVITIRPLPPAWADAALLRTALLNLLSNALKFTRGRERPQVELSGMRCGRWTTVHVRDNGVGFDPSASHQLFRPFVRLHTHEYEGHGVGLSIVRSVVERHGGRIWARSSVGQGACFSFSLPHDGPGTAPLAAA